MPGVLIVVATAAEARHLPRDRAVVAGVGGERAVAAIEAAIRERSPSLVVHAGFAGALDASLPPGAVLRPGRFVRPDGGEVRVAPTGPTIVTTDVIASVADKRDLRRQTGADAVDMEGFDVASYAAAAGVPVRFVRAVCDPSEFELPPEAAGWVDERGRARLGEVIRWAGLRPGRYHYLGRLRRSAGIAARRLADAVRRLR